MTSTDTKPGYDPQATEAQIDMIEQQSKGAVALRDRAADVPIGDAASDLVGVKYENVKDMITVAEIMAKAGSAVRPFLRGNVGNCFAIVVRAAELRMSPFALANWAYEVKNRGVESIAYESAFYHAVILSRGPFKKRPEHKVVGEGDARKCIVWATLKGEDSPRYWPPENSGEEYTLGKLRPGRNDQGQIKGSPLWETKPELQLFYNMLRDFARVYCPDTLAGLYTREELEEHEMRDVTPQPEQSRLAQRLAERSKRKPKNGFNAEKATATIDGDAKPATETTEGQAAPSGEATAADQTTKEQDK